MSACPVGSCNSINKMNRIFLWPLSNSSFPGLFSSLYCYQKVCPDAIYNMFVSGLLFFFCLFVLFFVGDLLLLANLLHQFWLVVFSLKSEWYQVSWIFLSIQPDFNNAAAWMISSEIWVTTNLLSSPDFS